MHYPNYYLPDADDFVLIEDAADGTSIYDQEVPLQSEYWICTCGHRNEGAEQCADCGEYLHERDWYWDEVP
jgi:hypothetical protein